MWAHFYVPYVPSPISFLQVSGESFMIPFEVSFQTGRLADLWILIRRMFCFSLLRHVFLLLNIPPLPLRFGSIVLYSNPLFVPVSSNNIFLCRSSFFLYLLLNFSSFFAVYWTDGAREMCYPDPYRLSEDHLKLLMGVRVSFVRWGGVGLVWGFCSDMAWIWAHSFHSCWHSNLISKLLTFAAFVREPSVVLMTLGDCSFCLQHFSRLWRFLVIDTK